MPNKISSGEKIYKFFIGYLCGDFKIKPLHKMLPKTRAYVKSYGNNKFSANIKRGFDSKPIYDKKCFKIKILSKRNETIPDKGIPRAVSDYTFIAGTTINSAIKNDINYYPQVYLKECKYFEK